MTTQITTPRPLYGWAQPNQRNTALNMGDKARQWLDGGVRLVWVVWPERREPDIWTRGAELPHTLAGDTMLDAGNIIPGVRIHLNDMW